MDDQTRDDGGRPKGVTRRGFITTVGAGAVTAAAVAGAQPQADAELTPHGEMAPITLRVNGRAHRLLAEPRWSLLHVLREHLGLSGTKVGCTRGERPEHDRVPRTPAPLTLVLEDEERPRPPVTRDVHVPGRATRALVMRDALHDASAGRAFDPPAQTCGQRRAFRFAHASDPAGGKSCRMPSGPTSTSRLTTTVGEPSMSMKVWRSAQWARPRSVSS